MIGGFGVENARFHGPNRCRMQLPTWSLGMTCDPPCAFGGPGSGLELRLHACADALAAPGAGALPKRTVAGVSWEWGSPGGADAGRN
jgi:hypothetical protein